MVHLIHMHFMFFTVLKNLKSFSEENMPEHALDIFLYKAMQSFWGLSRNEYNAFDVMDTVFHSCDTLDSIFKIEC